MSGKVASDLEAQYVDIVQKQSALISSEMTAGDQPGGETHGAKKLGGNWVTRTFRGFVSNVMTLSAVFASWTIENREHPKGGKRGALDYILMKTGTTMALKGKQETQDIQVFEVNPLPEDFSFIEIEGVRLLVGDVDQERLSLVVKNREDGVYLLQNKADFPEVEEKLDVILDFNQNGATLKPDLYEALPSSQPTLQTYLINARKRLKKDGVLLFSGKLATSNPKEQGYQKLDVPDDVGNDSYFYHQRNRITWLFAEQGFRLQAPEGLVDELNALNDGNEYELYQDQVGSFIIRKDGRKKPIFIVIAKKMENWDEDLMALEAEQFLPADSPVIIKPVVVETVDHGSLATPGGIDLGYGKNVRMEKSAAAGDFQDSDDIIQMRRDLKGIVPVPVGAAVPLKEFLYSKP